MNRREFQKLLKFTMNDPYKKLNITYESAYEQMEPLYGIGCHKERRFVTLAGAVAFIRWQCLRFDGTYDFNQVEDTAFVFKRVDIV